MANQTIKPGTEANSDMKLNVKDSKGKTVGEIKVPAGSRVPPTRTSGAETYKKK